MTLGLPMSKYDELCKSIVPVFEEFGRYKTEAHKLAFRIVEGLRSYLDCPMSKLWTFDWLNNEGPETQTPLGRAMKTDRDSWWNIGVAIHLDAGPYFFTQGYLLALRGIDSEWQVSIAGKDFTVRGDTDLEQVFAWVFEDLIHANEHGLEETLRGGIRRKIGFGGE